MVAELEIIGIMSAMPEEGEKICSEIENREVVRIGSREFVKGQLEGKSVVFALSGIGKVSSAVTATLMVERFHVTEIVFTGVAGGGRGVKIGDIVIGNSFLQHDMDARPILPQFFLFSVGKQVLLSDFSRIDRMQKAAQKFVDETKLVYQPTVHVGPIISGDQFIGSSELHQKIDQDTNFLFADGFRAIEMEGASVAQACHELGIPFVVLRAISDKAEDGATVDFLSFIENVAQVYAHGILKEYLR